MIKLCFIDVETTGVNHLQNGIIQIAGEIVFLEGLVAGTDGKHNLDVIDSFNYKIKPFARDVIDEKALEVNKTTRDEINSYPEPQKV